MLRLGVAVVAAGFAMGQSVLTRVSERPEILRQDTSRITGPIWNGSVLIGIEKNRSSAPIIWTLDSSGNKDEIHFSIPDAAIISVSGLAGSSDGTIAVAGGTLDEHGERGGFVGMIPPMRGSNTIVRTGLYTPHVVTIAPDGVIWTIGWQAEGQKVTNDVLKRFSASGKLLTSETLRVRGSPNTLEATMSSALRSSRDRVGWMTGGNQYLEFALDGRETNRFPGPPLSAKNYPSYVNISLAENFEVVANSTYQRKIWTLDRMKRVWNPVRINGEPLEWGWVYGFDGNQLVVGAVSKNRGFLLVHCSIEAQ